MTSNYPSSYHAAIAHLVAFGGHNYSATGRQLCARALRDLRRVFGSARARQEYRHMIFISGEMPVKGMSTFQAMIRFRKSAPCWMH